MEAEHTAPLGLMHFALDCYKHVAPTELGSFMIRFYKHAAPLGLNDFPLPLIQWQWGVALGWYEQPLRGSPEETT